MSLSRVDNPTQSINSYQVHHQKVSAEGDFELRDNLQNIIDSHHDGTIEIIQDHTVPTAKTSFDRTVTLSFVYGDWENARVSQNLNSIFLLVDYRLLLNDSNAESEISRDDRLEVSLKMRKDQVLYDLNFSNQFSGYNCDLLRMISGVGVYKCTNG
jgi:hypothetical protein